jgi:hypothetical protein
VAQEIYAQDGELDRCEKESPLETAAAETEL